MRSHMLCATLRWGNAQRFGAGTEHEEEKKNRNSSVHKTEKTTTKTARIIFI